MHVIRHQPESLKLDVRVFQILAQQAEERFPVARAREHVAAIHAPLRHVAREAGQQAALSARHNAMIIRPTSLQCSRTTSHSGLTPFPAFPAPFSPSVSPVSPRATRPPW